MALVYFRLKEVCLSTKNIPALLLCKNKVSINWQLYFLTTI
jgi:hypothetical protein